MHQRATGAWPWGAASAGPRSISAAPGGGPSGWARSGAIGRARRKGRQPKAPIRDSSSCSSNRSTPRASRIATMSPSPRGATSSCARTAPTTSRNICAASPRKGSSTPSPPTAIPSSPAPASHPTAAPCSSTPSRRASPSRSPARGHAARRAPPEPPPASYLTINTLFYLLD